MHVIPEWIREREAERVASWIADEAYDALPQEVKDEDGGRSAERMTEDMWSEVYEAVFYALAGIRTKWPL